MAVDRDVFSAEVQRTLKKHPNVTVVRERVDALPAEGPTIVATGPLTAQTLAESIVGATGQDRLAFFDAIAPIVHRDSIDMSKCWIQSRWNKRTAASNEDGDYINCPMTKEQYLAFHQGLIDGDKTEFKEWEADTPYFDGCMPIEVMAARGVETLRYGPMKGVGLDQSLRHQRGTPAGALALCGGAAAPGQQARHAVQHGRLPDQAEIWRANRAFPHDPGSRECRIRAAGRPAPQHLHQFAAGARHASCG